MSNGGANAQRGFIFQSIIAMIECLERDDWDVIKMEPETELDKVDFVLRKNGVDLTAIQVKSSKNRFGDKAVREWLEKLKEDAQGAEEYCLCLVGDSFTDACKEYIRERGREIRTVSFEHLQSICTRKIVDYILDAGIGGEVTVDDLDLIDCTLFSKIHRNSIAGEPMSRAAFEAAFRRIIPVRKTGRRLEGLPTIRNEIDDPCENFVEGAVRAEDMVVIKNMLTASRKPLWLHGQGGTGKTELVLHFAKTHPEYEYVFTSYAGSINQTVSKDLFILPNYELGGRKLNDEERYNANYDVFRQYAAQLKRENSNLILIIDNYSKQNTEKEFQEQTDLDILNGFSGLDRDLEELAGMTRTGIRIILTTRVEPQHSDVYRAYEVRKMSEEDLLKVMAGFFTGIHPYLEEEGIRDKLMLLIRLAAHRTVYVTVLAKAMQERGSDPVEALNAMLETLFSGVNHKPGYSTESLKIQVGLEEVLSFICLNYQEKQVLMTLSMLPDEGMEYEFYQKLTASNAVQLDRLRQMALKRLVNTGIVNRYQRKGELKNGGYGKVSILRMHPVIADFVYKVLVCRDKRAFIGLIKQNWINKLTNYFDDETLRNLKIDDTEYKYVSQLAVACSSTEQKLKILGEHLGYTTEDILEARENLLLCASDLSDKIGNVKDALEYAERAIAVDGPSSKNMQKFFYRLHKTGVIFYRGGKYPEAKQYFLDCLKILNVQNIIDVDDIDCPKNYNTNEIIQSDDAENYGAIFGWIGSVYIEQGNYVKALEYSEKDLAISEHVLGTDHPEMASTYNNLAKMYRAQGDYGKALKYHGKALTVSERVLGPDHPNTATTYNNLARVYEDLGDYVNALEYYGKALAIRERVLGTNHPSTATTYNNLAGVYRDQGDYVKALEYYEKAIAVSERVLGPDHPNTATTYNNLAGVYEDQGDYVNALEYYGKALAIHERVLGNNHPSTATTYNNLAGVYRDQGDYVKALEYYKRAYGIFLTKFGENHPHTKIVLSNIEIMESKTK